MRFTTKVRIDPVEFDLKRRTAQTLVKGEPRKGTQTLKVGVVRFKGHREGEVRVGKTARAALVEVAGA